MNRILKKTVAITLSITTLLSAGIVANATELVPVEKNVDSNGNVIVENTTNKTEYQSVSDALIPDIQPEEVKTVTKAEELDVDTTKTYNSDSAFVSCRLIISSQNEMEFKEAELGTDIIKSVQRFESYYVVEYINPVETEKAYNLYKEAGYEVEVDVVSDTPEVENKDNEGKDVDKTEIAGTNTENENTYVREDDIIVAVLDTGINSDEEIFKDKLIDGYDFANAKDNDKSKYPKDIDGHGTTMSRIILETADFENIKIMPIKVLDDNGKGTTLTAYQGIKYVIDYNKTHDNKVSVINLSMSGVGQSKLLESVINEAYNNGIVVVCSAGNDNKDVSEYTPANIDSAFTVASVDKVNNIFAKANYSNFGKNVDYTTSGHYEYTRIIDDREVITKVDGTSVSSAYVTSFVVMLKQMAISDEDVENDNLSIADIDTSLSESAVKLEDNTLGRGYLERENIQLKKVEVEVEELPVADVTDENIELTKDGGNVLWREFYVRGFPSSLNWAIRMYAVNDYNAFDQRYGYWISKNGYTEFGLPDGGVIKVSTNDTEARIEYNFCNIENWTPWVEVSYDVNNPTWRYEYTDRAYHPDNTWQDDAPEVHYKPDEMNPGYIDCYAGIGFKYADYQVHFIPRDFYVTYDCNGGSFADGQISYNRVAYSGVWGTNGFGLGVGCDAPIRTGYIFKGWFIGDYADDNIWVGKNTVTNLIDYSNRYADVKRAFGYRMSALNNHFWSYGLGEGRSIAEHCTCPLDVINGYNFDNYNQLLPASQFLSDMWQGDGAFQFNVAGKNLKAVAIWEPVKYTVNYNYNNGYGEKATQSCQFDSAYTVQAAPSKYKSANLVFDSNGGSAVGNVKTTKTFLGWDSDNDVGIFGTYVDYSRTTSSAYDTTYNAARYANVNPDLYNAFGGYTGTSLVSHWAAYAKKEGRVCTGSGNIYDASNYYQPNRTFKNLTVSNRTVNMTGRWKNNSAKLPSAPTRPEYDFLGWQAPDGKIYQPNDTYTPANDNDVTFTAVWRRNTAKVTYNPNGAVDENGNKYGTVTDENSTSLYSDYDLQSGSTFGTLQEEEKYIAVDKKGTNDIVDNAYYKVNKGDITNNLGKKTKMYSFQGWSVVDYADHTAEDILYGGTLPFIDIVSDFNAVLDKDYQTKPNNKTLKSIVNEIKERSKYYNSGNLVKWNEEFDNNGIVNMYATWDEYPEINTKELVFTERQFNNITEEDLLKKLTATDREDGDITKKVKILNFDDVVKTLNSLNTTAATTVTYEVTDSAGNTTRAYAEVWRNSDTPLEVSDPEHTAHIRSICRQAYDTHEPKNGGCMKDSLWYNNPEYVQVMLTGFDNMENDVSIMSYTHTKEDRERASEYIDEHGIGNAFESDGLKKYGELFATSEYETQNRMDILIDGNDEDSSINILGFEFKWNDKELNQLRKKKDQARIERLRNKIAQASNPQA